MRRRHRRKCSAFSLTKAERDAPARCDQGSAWPEDAGLITRRSDPPGATARPRNTYKGITKKSLIARPESFSEGKRVVARNPR